jgi:hypothetical protein
VKVFKIKIIYKSGATHEFLAKKFEYEGFAVGGKVTWKTYSMENQPLLFGLDDVAAIWQVGVLEVGDNS